VPVNLINQQVGQNTLLGYLHNDCKGQRKMSNFGSFWSRREGRRQRAAERIGNFLKIRKESLEKLIKRGIFRPNRVFGSTIPAIVKVTTQTQII
jgi:hypothetical protein